MYAAERSKRKMNDELVEQQLDTTEKRLDDHAERIRKLESVTAVMDNMIVTR